MTKRLAIAFGLGAAMPLLLALYLGGEWLAVAGFRLSAIENGLRLAASDWQVDGVPAHQEPERVAQIEAAGAKKAKRGR